MNIGKWILGWQRSYARQNVDVALYITTPDGGRDILQKDGLMHHIPPGETIKEPSLSLSEDQLQAFMDGLWEMGIRPKEVRYERELDLMRGHLEDFRKLVFEKRIK
jgi:hypothetical protein